MCQNIKRYCGKCQTSFVDELTCTQKGKRGHEAEVIDWTNEQAKCPGRTKWHLMGKSVRESEYVPPKQQHSNRK